MNAQEARALAKGISSEAAKTQYEDIKKKIRDRARNEHLCAYWYDNLKTSVRLKLEEEGFKITSDFTRNETTITISW